MILTFFLLAEQTFSERLKIAPSRTLANVRNGDRTTLSQTTLKPLRFIIVCLG